MDKEMFEKGLGIRRQVLARVLGDHQVGRLVDDNPFLLTGQDLVWLGAPVTATGTRLMARFAPDWISYIPVLCKDQSGRLGRCPL